MGTESSTSRSITSIERRTVFFLHKRNPGSYHDRHENGPQTYHDMIAVVEEWDIVRPAIAGKFVQSLNLGSPAPMREKAQYSRDINRIIQSLPIGVGLADENDSGATLAFK